MQIHILQALSDNYIYLLQHGQDACVIDPSSAQPVLKALKQTQTRLKLILNTHSHYDHTGGNVALQKTTGCNILSSKQSSVKNQAISFADINIEIIHTPGHTQDSVCFYIPGKPGYLFTGDTLFVGGCGRIFDGTASQLWESLQRLKSLPDDTHVYCGHEYTLDNVDFALCVEPENQALLKRKHDLVKLAQKGKPSVPSTIGLEKDTNPFMRAKTAEHFIELRKQKDVF